MHSTVCWGIFLSHRKATFIPVRAMLKSHPGKWTWTRMKKKKTWLLSQLPQRFSAPKSQFSPLNLLTPWQFTPLLTQTRALSLITLLPSSERLWLVATSVWLCVRMIMHGCLHIFSTHRQDSLTMPFLARTRSCPFFFRQHTGVLKTQKQLRGKGRNRKRLRNRQWPPRHRVAGGWRLVLRWTWGRYCKPRRK